MLRSHSCIGRIIHQTSPSGMTQSLNSINQQALVRSQRINSVAASTFLSQFFHRNHSTQRCTYFSRATCSLSTAGVRTTSSSSFLVTQPSQFRLITTRSISFSSHHQSQTQPASLKSSSSTSSTIVAPTPVASPSASTSILNFSALSNRVELTPYDTYLFTNLISPTHQLALAQNYPTKNFAEFTLDQYGEGNENVASTFFYKFEYMKIEQFDNEYLQTKQHLSPIWCQFIQAITSPEYVTALSKAVNVDLSDKQIRIECMKYRPGDSLDPHHDKQSSKVLTQLFYFNAAWNVGWGGLLQVLNPSKLDEIVLAVPPLVNYSIALKPTPMAWHSVNRVSEQAKENRLNIVLEFYTK